MNHASKAPREGSARAPIAEAAGRTPSTAYAVDNSPRGQEMRDLAQMARRSPFVLAQRKAFGDSAQFKDADEGPSPASDAPIQAVWREKVAHEASSYQRWEQLETDKEKRDDGWYAVEGETVGERVDARLEEKLTERLPAREPGPSAVTGATEPPSGGLRRIRTTDYEVLDVFKSGSTKPQKIRFGEGAVYPKGTIKVLKFGKDEEHVRTEVLSQKIYDAIGIATLPAELVEVVEGDNPPVLAQLTDFVADFKVPEMEDLRSSPDFYRHAAADMVFANWDLFKRDNWMQIGARMVRADLGGALDRRAQGDLKSSDEWRADEVGEFKSMRSNKKASDNPYALLTDHELADAVHTLLLHFDEAKLEHAFEAVAFPDGLRERMAQTLRGRLAVARAWAEQVYKPEVYPATPLTAAPHAQEGEGEDGEIGLDIVAELAGMGITIAPAWLGNPDLIRAHFASHVQHRGGHLSLPDADWPDEIKVKPVGRSDDPRTVPPMVGPEELLRDDQFGGGLAEKMPGYFSRMKTGRLVRRMSIKEKENFIAATRSNNIGAVLAALFDQGNRGEIVLSVNDIYVFTKKDEAAQDDSPDYAHVMEMPITDAMLQFLSDYAYVNNPTGGSKPTAFLGNPTLKFEGASGGRSDSGGVPNIVIKKSGFEAFWTCVKEVRFVKYQDHVVRHGSSNAELVRAKVESERNEKIAAAEAIRKQKEKEGPTDVDLEGGLWGDAFGFDTTDEEGATEAEDTPTPSSLATVEGPLGVDSLVLIEHIRREWTVARIRSIHGNLADVQLPGGGPRDGWREPLATLLRAPPGKKEGDRYPKT